MVKLENHRANKNEQPYKVHLPNTKGAVHLKIGTVTDTANIRHIHPTN